MISFERPKMNNGVTYSAGYLRGKSFYSSNLDDIATGTYDLAILVPSWDRRSVCITRATNFRAKLGIVVVFDDRDDKGMRDAHDPLVLGFAGRACETVSILRGSTASLEQLWSDVLSLIVKLHGQLRRPLRIFVDGSACTRYLLLGVVATTLSSGLASDVSAMYAEGTYIPSDGLDERIVFTDGQWKSLPIPGLEGKYRPGLGRFYLVSIGFEGWKTMRAVTRADPDRVSILHGNPGTKSEYTNKSLLENAPLIEHFQVPSAQIVQAPAGDAIAAWSALSIASVERPQDENCYFLCSGTKAHSLALGLRAMSLQSPAVIYNLPEAHRVLPIEPNGRFWRFDIRSLTVPRVHVAED
jgi:hypothetical protein